MNISKFNKLFGTESKCLKHFINYRKNSVIHCNHCHKETQHTYLHNRKLFVCTECGHRISYKSGTVMEKSKLPLSYWYLAFYIVANTKKPISALELQKLIGHKFYEPVWMMLHKIRSMMGSRDSKYLLDGMIEMDETYVQTAQSKQTKAQKASQIISVKKNKQGKGTDKKTVLVMVERGYRYDKIKDRNVPYPKFIKLEYLDAGCTANDINYYLQKDVTTNSTLITDNATYYKFQHTHITHNLSKSSSDVVKNELGGVHLTASNMKRNFLGIMHSINEKYLQNYLNEFAYRFNRRFFVKEDNMFEHLFKIAF